MFEKFYPDLVLDKVQDIDLEMAREKGIKGFLLDIDNTLVPHGKEADDSAIAWIEGLKAGGFKVCIVSNASNTRVIKFNERLQVHAIHRASKPGTKAFIKALKLMNLDPSEAAVVGDQIFTDIYGGNKLDLYTILVMPIDKRELFFIKFKRVAEKFVLQKYKRDHKIRSSIRTRWKRQSASKKYIR